MTLHYEDVPNAPSILKGVTVNQNDKAILGEPYSWAVLNKILIKREDRMEMTKKALLLELHSKRRTYEAGRLLSYIIQSNVDDIRNQATEELHKCLKP